jgi:hypothetical protein
MAMPDLHVHLVDHPTARLVGRAPTLVALRAQIRHLAGYDTVSSPHVPTPLRPWSGLCRVLPSLQRWLDVPDSYDQPVALDTATERGRLTSNSALAGASAWSSPTRDRFTLGGPAGG